MPDHDLFLILARINTELAKKKTPRQLTLTTYGGFWRLGGASSPYKREQWFNIPKSAEEMYEFLLGFLVALLHVPQR